jgi:DNA-binding IclR family transcriptional regulator
VERTISGVGVLDKAMQILDALSDARARNLGELVAATGLPRATAHRLAHALQAHGLTVLGSDERWRLGPRLGELSSAAGDDGAFERSLIDAARPALEQLLDETGESVQMYVSRHGARVCLFALDSPHSLRTIVRIGAALPLDRGSAGKVLSGLDGVGRRGWAQSVEEREKGVASVSAPILRDGRTVAAVSVSGPVERTTRAPGRRYSAAVTAAARRIEEAAGWRS